jgi:hypothetical protein
MFKELVKCMVRKAYAQDGFVGILPNHAGHQGTNEGLQDGGVGVQEVELCKFQKRRGAIDESRMSATYLAGSWWALDQCHSRGQGVP